MKMIYNYLINIYAHLERKLAIIYFVYFVVLLTLFFHPLMCMIVRSGLHQGSQSNCRR